MRTRHVCWILSARWLCFVPSSPFAGIPDSPTTMLCGCWALFHRLALTSVTLECHSLVRPSLNNKVPPCSFGYSSSDISLTHGFVIFLTADDGFSSRIVRYDKWECMSIFLSFSLQWRRLAISIVAVLLYIALSTTLFIIGPKIDAHINKVCDGNIRSSFGVNSAEFCC